MPAQKISGVYALTNRITHNRYVGSGKDVANRRSSHFSKLKYRTHKNWRLQADYDQYGRDSFDFEILAELPVDEARVIEQQHIDSGAFKSNIAPKASGGGCQNARTIDRMRKSHTGKKHRPETIAKIKARPAEVTGSFKGYYHTLAGKFASSYDAADAIGAGLNYTTVKRWCRNPDKVISAQSYGRCGYLKAIGSHVIGKTYRDLGFSFQPVEKP